jgi:hypothetical protein
MKLASFFLSTTLLSFSFHIALSQSYVESTTDGKVKAKNFIYQNPKVSYYSIDESQFVGTEGGIILRGRINGTGGAFFYTNPNPILFGMFAPINLPNGCKITKVTAYCEDTSPNYNLNIKVSTHNLVNGVYTDISTLVSSGSSGYSALSNSNINHVVNNIGMSYQILVTVVDSNNNNAAWQGFYTVIRGLTIEYSSEETN